MQIFPNSYSAVGFSRKRFARVCEQLACTLPDMIARYNADAVVVRGTSGYSVAFGVAIFDEEGKIPFVVARKKGEGSHGSALEGVGRGVLVDMRRYLFLDDLVATGSTVRTLAEDMDEFAKRRSSAPPCLAAVLKYESGGHKWRQEDDIWHSKRETAYPVWSMV